MWATVSLGRAVVLTDSLPATHGEDRGGRVPGKLRLASPGGRGTDGRTERVGSGPPGQKGGEETQGLAEAVLAPQVHILEGPQKAAKSEIQPPARSRDFRHAATSFLNNKTRQITGPAIRHQRKASSFPAQPPRSPARPGGHRAALDNESPPQTALRAATGGSGWPRSEEMTSCLSVPSRPPPRPGHLVPATAADQRRRGPWAARGNAAPGEPPAPHCPDKPKPRRAPGPGGQSRHRLSRGGGQGCVDRLEPTCRPSRGVRSPSWSRVADSGLELLPSAPAAAALPPGAPPLRVPREPLLRGLVSRVFPPDPRPEARQTASDKEANLYPRRSRGLGFQIVPPALGPAGSKSRQANAGALLHTPPVSCGPSPSPPAEPPPDGPGAPGLGPRSPLPPGGRPACSTSRAWMAKRGLPGAPGPGRRPFQNPHSAHLLGKSQAVLRQERRGALHAGRPWGPAIRLAAGSRPLNSPALLPRRHAGPRTGHAERSPPQRRPGPAHELLTGWAPALGRPSTEGGAGGPRGGSRRRMGSGQSPPPLRATGCGGVEGEERHGDAGPWAAPEPRPVPFPSRGTGGPPRLPVPRVGPRRHRSATARRAWGSPCDTPVILATRGAAVGGARLKASLGREAREGPLSSRPPARSGAAARVAERQPPGEEPSQPCGSEFGPRDWLNVNRQSREPGRGAAGDPGCRPRGPRVGSLPLSAPLPPARAPVTGPGPTRRPAS
ncbi:collagen alpha-1(II) chain-like [Perognathus longimembris pacificus]|uniref:collagen alpha-1(II) chain-like n=1 Tax=Perognathus longimembris pacificus TaxID=214514 RepID=UPI00201946FB|nr:collagen alpha-1(II) chain-like [Perognathus longimembris pacificus]